MALTVTVNVAWFVRLPLSVTTSVKPAVVAPQAATHRLRDVRIQEGLDAHIQRLRGCLLQFAAQTCGLQIVIDQVMLKRVRIGQIGLVRLHPLPGSGELARRIVRRIAWRAALRISRHIAGRKALRLAIRRYGVCAGFRASPVFRVVLDGFGSRELGRGLRAVEFESTAERLAKALKG